MSSTPGPVPTAAPATGTAAAAAAAESDPAELTKFVENLLEQMNARFKAMSDTIIGRIDEMGGKIEELEKSVNGLLAQTTAAQQAPK